MSTTAILILARGGSKRLPGKNLKALGGLSLLGHSIRYAQAEEDYPVYVSTEDPAIKAEALTFGAQVIDRPAALAGDTASSVAVVQQALAVLPNSVQTVVLLQPTNPFRPQGLLGDALKVYQEQELSSLFTVSPELKKLGKLQEQRFIPQNYSPGQRSQDLEPWYYENGLLYIADRAVITSGTLMPESTYPMVVDHVFGTVDIDTQEDWDYAEFVLSRYGEEISYL